jgi:hypothetical protein
MRRLRDGKIEVNIRASNLARMYYFQEFGSDFDKDLAALRTTENTAEAEFGVFKIIWAMCKAEGFYTKKSTPCYPQWFAEFGALDLEQCLGDVLDEIEAGFNIIRTYGKGGGGKAGSLAQRIIAIALKLGMNMDELNELSTQALIDIMHEFVGDDKDAPRWASAHEVDAYF